MSWEEIRALYPNQWVKLHIIGYHVEGDYLFIDKMSVIQAISSAKDATHELANCKGNNIIYHTSHHTIKTKKIKNLGIFRSIPN
ncbi:hypothetical protein [Clostridium omnivorum]|uniref:DUF5678 domain-containing protein n=1 Tax=Clostridium omnivorum TaxID=1604902 RepID=A0ABQ5N7W1_9CLOT|nr:hypothetical protein [Clostridium sp. E14]GLC31120.1 hypothetical protein bsdE14_25300 [Clostridium sp. E14]